MLDLTIYMAKKSLLSKPTVAITPIFVKEHSSRMLSAHLFHQMPLAGKVRPELNNEAPFAVGGGELGSVGKKDLHSEVQCIIDNGQMIPPTLPHCSQNNRQTGLKT